MAFSKCKNNYSEQRAQSNLTDMKHLQTIIPILIFVSISMDLIAQIDTEDKSLNYFNKTEAGVSFGIGSFNTDVYNGIQKKVRNDEIVVTIQTINGFRYMNRVGIGLSLGVELWQDGLFWPIYGYLSYDFKPADNTFFANIYLGYAPGTRKASSFYQEAKGGFAFSAGVGYRMKVTEKLKFMYEVFYKYQSLESSYYNYYVRNDSVIAKQRIDNRLSLNFAGFKIGIIFP